MEEIKHTILIIEDDAGLVELLKESVESCGYQTVCCLNAGSALDWLKVNVPFLIVMDYGLPDMNGKELIAELITSVNSLPPFVVSTGQGDERIAVEMMKLGARDYIIKDSHFLDMIPLIICKVCTEIVNEKKLKSTEKALTESTQFNNHIVNSAHEGIIVYDMNRNCQVWNHYMEQLNGIPASDVLGKKTIDLFPFLQNADYIKHFDNAYRGIISNGIEFQFELPSTGKSGWVSETLSTLLNADNEIIGVISMVRNITERKNAEIQIDKLLKYWQTTFDGINNSIFLLDPDGIILQSNKYSETLFGIQNEKIIGHHCYEVVHQTNCRIDGCPCVKLGIDKMRNSMILYFDEKWLEIVVDPVLDEANNIIAIVHIATDITERKHSEVILQQERELYLDLVNSQPEGIYRVRIFPIEKWEKDAWNNSVNPPYSMELVSDRFCEIIGVSKAEFETNPGIINDLVHPEDKSEFVRLNEESNVKQVPFYWEGRLIVQLETIWVHFESLPRKLSNGDILFTGIVYDITAHKQAEKELKDKMDEMNHFHRLTVGRELTMIELKKEVNQLLNEAGKEKKYNIVG